MPRLAGAMPKLRPSATLPAMTTSSPTPEISAVAMSGATAIPSADRTSGGPASDSVVATVAAIDRSRMLARRRTIVSTTTSDSLASSRSPVMWPVRMKSPNRFTDIRANRPATNARATRSRTASAAGAMETWETSSKARVSARATLGNTGHLRLGLDEVRRANTVKEFTGNCRLHTPIPTERRHLIQQVARVARPHRTPRRLVMPPQQIRDDHRVEVEAAPHAVQLEDPRILLDRRILDGDLVGDPAQERFVGQRLGIEVGREDDQHFERDLEFLTGVQREVVHAALERHDPAVQEVLRADALPAEVVHDEHAAVRLELQRRLVELGQRVERQLHHVERELAADGHDRPSNPHPAPVAPTCGDDAVRIVGFFERLVVDGIEHRDDLAV